MNYIYLILIILAVSFQNIVQKPYTQKTEGKGVFTFTLMSSLAALLFFIITSKGLKFDSGILLYSFFFALSYMTCSVSLVAAIGSGSLSLTTLINSYSLMLPTLYGLIFLKDAIKPGLIPGIILLAISLFLTNKKGSDKKFSVKWLIYVSLAFVGNGMCTIVQKSQQLAFDGAYKNEFMIAALSMVVILLIPVVLKKEGKNALSLIKAGWKWALPCGLANGLTNMLVMVLSGIMAASLMFPLISAGGLIITYLVSKFFYKEYLTKLQTAGMFVGLASVILLNL
ncbi:MAG: hypothetical protein E7665_00355 [Ruminococcaceae bacterium]|nr:hypothetical protein [Oscillospiraceae bacterium]